MITERISHNMGKVLITLVIATILILIAGLTTARNAGAQGAASCFGTYLVNFNNLSEGMWSLSLDGTMHSTDSGEQFLGFSHLQGSWEPKGKTAKMTMLDFTIDPNATTPAGYARVDAELEFEGHCESMTGTYDLWLYGPSEDPLDRTTGGFLAGEDLSFTGRRINP